jgi:hypothetical protein
MKRPLIATLALLASACSLITPPIDTPHTPPQSITFSQMTNGLVAAGTTAPVIVPAFPPFPINPPQGMAISVPSNAQTVNLSSAILHMKLQNQMKVPLNLNISLSKTSTPYSDSSAATASVSLSPGQTTQSDLNVDPTLFKQATVYLGVGVGTPGTGGQLTTVSGSDAVTVESWVTVQVKLF